MEQVIYANVPFLGNTTDIRFEKTTSNRAHYIEADICIEINNSYDDKITFWDFANRIYSDINKYCSSCVLKASRVPIIIMDYENEEIMFDCYLIYDNNGPSLYIVSRETSEIYEMKAR